MHDLKLISQHSKHKKRKKRKRKTERRKAKKGKNGKRKCESANNRQTTIKRKDAHGARALCLASGISDIDDPRSLPRPSMNVLKEPVRAKC